MDGIRHLLWHLLLALAIGDLAHHGFKASAELENPTLTRRRRAAIADTRWRWTNAVIPYEFLSGHWRNATQRNMVKEAMDLWQDNTCLEFRPKTPSDKNWVTYRDGGNCYSMLGMVGGRQYLTLGNSAGCRKLGLAIHEIGHAIGLVHEHQLPSRDQYIRVHLGHVFGGAQTEFRKMKPEEVNTYGVPYDITSIMHYGKYAMSGSSDWKTIEAVDSSKNYMIVPVADKKKMSFSDLKVVNLMYNCSAHCPHDSSCKKPGYLDKTCKCIQPEYVEYCKNKKPECEKWKANGQCRSAKTFMEINCPISCGICKPRGGLTPEVFPTMPPKKIDCRDKNPLCDDWASRNQCTINKLYMEDECPIACGLCGVKKTTPKPKPKPCVNRYPEASCTKWAKKGECTNNPSFMKKQCRKACGVCQVEGGGTAGNTEVGGKKEGGKKEGKKEEEQGDQPRPRVFCKNRYGDRDCNRWAKGGECDQNPEFMKLQCALACGVCQEGETGTADCHDSSELCAGWATLGYCRTNKYTKDNCKRTCGTC